MNLNNQEVSLCLIGFGNAAQAFCKMLMEQEATLKQKCGTAVKVTAIATRRKGVLMDLAGIQLERALNEVGTAGKFMDENPQKISLNTLECIEQSKADVLIELSTVSIEDGQPAIGHIETALENRMHVITANKGPIAWDYRRLKEMADQRKIELLHEAVVLDGAPVFNMMREVMPGCQVMSFKGILNTTSNYILEEMEKGNVFEEAVAEAQRRGFAEADPSLDVDGWDAAAKTSALLNVLMDGDTNPGQIRRQGIGKISLENLKAAAEKNGKIKLICEGFMENGRPAGRVSPEFVSRSNLFSTIDSTSSVLSITTDLMGEICMVERDPEIQQTAYGIYSDLLTLIGKLAK